MIFKELHQSFEESQIVVSQGNRFVPALRQCQLPSVALSSGPSVLQALAVLGTEPSDDWQQYVWNSGVVPKMYYASSMEDVAAISSEVSRLIYFFRADAANGPRNAVEQVFKCTDVIR